MTTVAPQALALLNNNFIHQQSESLARYVLAEPGDEAVRVHRAWRRVLSREPRESEIAAATAHVASQKQRFAANKTTPPTEHDLLAWTSLCHVLLNTNEFVYVD